MSDNPIIITKNKFEILEYQCEKGELVPDDFVGVNYFGEKIFLTGSEIIMLYEYLMRHRRPDKKDIL
jgi:hypothetical protein